MKERITFIVSDPSHTHPDNLILGSDSLKIKSLPGAAREDRLTFDSNALPPPFKQLLEKVQLGHLRWSSGRFYEAATPYAARVPAGLHILTTPGRLQGTDFFPEESEKKGVLEKNYDDPFLSAAWGINHSRELRVEYPFKIGPWESTFYSPVQEITPFRDFLKKVLDNQKGVLRADNLNWMKRLDRLQDADYVDVKYDAVSHKVEVSVYWGPSEVDRSGYLVANAEVGIMGTDRAEEEEDVKVAGYIYEIGDSDHLEPVMFSFPSRHHKVPSTFTLTTNTPTGLHPTLHLSLSGPLKPPREDGDCTLNAYFTLPSSLFVDKYQLSSTNANLLRQLNIRRLRDVTGNTDLEAPEYNIQDWGSRVLIEIDTDRVEGSNPKTLEVELPLHLRYLRPAVNSSSTEVTFAWPSVFWACKSESWRKMSNSPFDRAGLGWEDLFPEQVMYYHLSPVPGEKAPAENGMWGRIQAPVLDRGWGNEEMIKTWTVAAVGIGFVWVIGAVLWARVLSAKKEVKKEEVVKKVQ